MLAALLPCVPAQADDGTRAAGQAVSSLYVELVLNGRATGDIIPLKVAEGHMLVDVSDLQRNGIMLPGTGEIDLAAFSQIKAAYAPELQLLKLDVPAEMMPMTHLGSARPIRIPASADRGAMFNYDLYLQHGNGKSAAALWTEQRIFGPLGIFSNSGVARFSAADFSHKGYLRYDTQLRLIDEERALAVTAGDLITRSLPWTGSVRIGGIQIGRDFSVRPDLLTMPLPRFAGSTAVPAAVDLVIDGSRSRAAEMASGRFLIEDVPVVNGAGQATIVTTDAVGRQIMATIPFYVSAELLKPGLSDYSLELGSLRKNYGQRSFGYGPAVASASLRHGLTPKLTAELHGEITKNLWSGGAGAVFAPFRIGTFSISAAASGSCAGSAALWTAGYSYVSRRFSIAVQHQERGRGFQDLMNWDFPGRREGARNDRVVASVNIPRQGSLGLAYIAGRTLRSPATRLAALSYTRALGGSASLFLSGDRDFSRGVTRAQLRIIVPFGRTSVAGGIGQSSDGRLLSHASFSRALPASGGLGLDAAFAIDDSGRTTAQGLATMRTPSSQVQLGGARSAGGGLIWASASGSIVAMDSDLFLSNRISDAFAVVSSDGMPGVGVRYENQFVGVTDRKGRLLVPGVSSHLPVTFNIDTLKLSAGDMAASVEKRMAIRRGSGATIHLPVRRVRSITVILAGPDGRPLAVGGRANWQNRQEAEIGWDGVVYLEDVSDHVVLDVTRQDGSTCKAQFDLPADMPPLARIGPVLCT